LSLVKYMDWISYTQKEMNDSFKGLWPCFLIISETTYSSS
jgi:hypothetical protein